MNEHVSVELTVNGRIVGSERTVLYKTGNSLQMVYNNSGLQVDDGGIYMCQSEINLGGRIFTSSKSFKLTFPLQLIGEADTEITSFVGEDIEIVCEIQGYPTPNWSFQHDDNNDVQNITNVTVVANRLTIDYITAVHAGVYTCIGEQEDGVMSLRQNISLVVLGVSENGGDKGSENGGDKGSENGGDTGNEKCGTSSQRLHDLLVYFTAILCLWSFVLLQ